MRRLLLAACWTAGGWIQPNLRILMSEGRVHRSESTTTEAVVSTVIAFTLAWLGLSLCDRVLRGRSYLVRLAGVACVAVAGLGAMSATFVLRSALAKGIVPLEALPGIMLMFAIDGSIIALFLGWWVILPLVLLTTWCMKQPPTPSASRSPAAAPP